jgi:hypothetical protein
MKKLIFSLLIVACILVFTQCKKKVEGCMDATAANYNPDATVANESCYYPSFYETANKIYDDFETDILNSMWFSTTSGCGGLAYDPTHSTLCLNTGVYQACGGSANVISNKKFSVSNGTLTFEGKIQPYEDNNSAYGDGQPRGLADGTDRNNAIEFISTTGSTISCRTVVGGVATETAYAIGSTVNYMRVYKIIATSSSVQFYLNNSLMATHTTNIPTVPLNVYFGSSCGIYGNVPITVDYVSYGIN